MRDNRHSGYWICCVCLLLWLIPLGTCAGQQAGPVVIPVDADSGPGSPLRVSGHVSFLETLAASEVTSFRSEDISARNISNKPILLIVSSLDVAGPRSSGAAFDLVVDYFFKEKSMLPGQDEVLLRRPFGESYTTEPFRTAASRERPPKAQFHLRFVQFSDGSTFGDPSAATKWLGRRESALASLKKLRQAYDEGGETALSRALDEDLTATQLMSIWEEIRGLQRADGPRAVVAFIDGSLAAALEHEAALDRHR